MQLVQEKKILRIWRPIISTTFKRGFAESRSREIIW
jgi:hypothetical protein